MSRVLVGAPRGTFYLVPDPLEQRENNTGLVYSCPLTTTGDCEGVRGDTSLYIGVGLDDVTNSRGSVSNENQLFPQPVSEGRLFDQSREL